MMENDAEHAECDGEGGIISEIDTEFGSKKLETGTRGHTYLPALMKWRGCSHCCGFMICMALMVVIGLFLLLASPTLMVLGSICINKHNNNTTTVDIWCPNITGSTAFLIIGCLGFCVCCWTIQKFVLAECRIQLGHQ